MIPKSILFVCMGNICRSPMAEGVFLHLLKREHREKDFLIDSAGTIGYHAGEMPDSRMRMHAARRGYSLESRSRKFTRADFDRFDLIVAMDDANYDDLCDIAQTIEEKNKVVRMADYCTIHQATHIPDPYYGGDKGFEYVIDLLEDACENLYNQLINQSTN
jgi:protein-tyrosine phosphatase